MGLLPVLNRGHGITVLMVTHEPDMAAYARRIVLMLALLFSAFIGVVFGYFPVTRAARMDPIEALRYG